jgi:hypothetical protein
MKGRRRRSKDGGEGGILEVSGVERFINRRVPAGVVIGGGARTAGGAGQVEWSTLIDETP